MKLSLFKKVAVLLLALMLIAPVSVSIEPRPAHAQVASIVHDPINWIQEQISALFNGTTAANTTADKLKQYVLDPLAWAVAKAAVQSITASVVRWINSGFQGAPSFITNPTQLYIQLGDVAAITFFNDANKYFLGNPSASSLQGQATGLVQGQVIGAIGGTGSAASFQAQATGLVQGQANSLLLGTGSASPFQPQVSSALQQNYFKSTAPGGFFLLNPYTLNQFSTNPAGFLSGQAGSFSQGGWSGWFALTTNPSNNPIGSYYLQQAELNSRIAGAQGVTQNQLNQNRGFLSWCATDANQPVVVGGASPSNFITPSAPVDTGSVVETTAGTGGLGSASAAAIAAAGNSNAPVDASGGIAPTLAATQVPAAARQQGCINSNGQSGTVQTPGSVIESQLENVLGSGIAQLNLANSFNEIVGALAQQLILQVLGPNGLFGTSQPSASGAPSFADQLAGDTSASAQIAASALATLSTSVSQDIQQVQTYQADWAKIGAAASAAQTALNTVVSSGVACTFSESGDAQSVLASTVQPVVDQAAAAAATASAALTALNTIQIEINSATTTSTEATSTTATAQKATTDFQNLQGSGTLPSADEVAYAQTESASAAASGSATTTASTGTSLFDQMNNVVQEAQACMVTTG